MPAKRKKVSTGRAGDSPLRSQLRRNDTLTSLPEKSGTLQRDIHENLMTGRADVLKQEGDILTVTAPLKSGSNLGKTFGFTTANTDLNDKTSGRKYSFTLTIRSSLSKAKSVLENNKNGEAHTFLKNY